MITCPKHTIWGAVQGHGTALGRHEVRARVDRPGWDKYAEGWDVRTAGHGGIVLCDEAHKKIPAYFRAVAEYGVPERQYEEDCNIALVVLVFPDWFRCKELNYGENQIQMAHTMIARRWPDLYARFMGADAPKPQQMEIGA